MIKFEFVTRIKQDRNFQSDGWKMGLPRRSTKKSAGYDFINPEEVTIQPKEIEYVKTGIKACFPDDFVLKLYNRSSNAKKLGLVLVNGVGIVDADYYDNPDNEGEIAFAFMNIKDEPVTLEYGCKLGQGIFERYYTVDEEDEVTAERTSGFGSTGN